MVVIGIGREKGREREGRRGWVEFGVGVDFGGLLGEGMCGWRVLGKESRGWRYEGLWDEDAKENLDVLEIEWLSRYSLGNKEERDTYGWQQR